MNLKKYRIRNFEGGIETHEVFLDNLAREKENDLGIAVKKFEVPIREKLAYLIFIVFACLTTLLISQTVLLQVISGKELSAQSDDNKIRPVYSEAERGVIYDSNLKQLVYNNPSFDLVCDKRDLATLSLDITREIEDMANLISKKPEEIKNVIEADPDSKVLIYENLPHETLVMLEAKLKDFPGFEIEATTVRNYSTGAYFSQLVGFMSKVNKNDLRSYSGYSISDYIGRTGLEKSYEQNLRGVPGVTQIEKDAAGNIKDERQVSLPQSGQSLVLYLDSGLQKKLTEVLQERLITQGVKKAAAVAIDPKTGGILAFVSLPSFDNNVMSGGGAPGELQKIQSDPNQPFFNRVVSGQYPIGSTIKPMLACGALQENVISADKQIYDPGYLEVRSQYDSSVVYRYNGLEAPGYYDVRSAIAQSSNIYFYTVGGGYQDQQGLGPARIKKYLELFGFGAKTQIDLPGEATGFVPSPEWKKRVKGENWWDGDTYHLSIGQGDLTATPLQVALAYAAIANGGTLYKPAIAKEIVDTSSGSIKVVQEIEPQIVRQDFIDPEHIKAVQEGMRQGVTSGTGRVLQSLPVKAASKTGTAQTPRDGIYEIWANVFAPYDNPEIEITIITEDVEGLHVPSLMVARDVLQWYFSR